MSQKLPSDVLEAIHANRKIEAIKRLREHTGLGLKEAKQQVETYQRAHPELIKQAISGNSNASGTLVLAIALLLIGYGVYRLLT